jgi:hemolysin III
MLLCYESMPRMMKAAVITEYREQAIGEEIANSISHGLGFVGAVAITPILIIKAVPSGTAAIIGACIFGSTMMFLYLSSTLYHAFPHNQVKRLFLLFDHGCIFLLIAGTYTPFSLTLLPTTWGWAMFSLVWVFALLGIIIKTVFASHSGRFSIILYVGMGWFTLIAIKPMWNSLSPEGVFWLLAGGIMYSTGVIFFLNDHKIRYGHFIWHLFVMAGTMCHVVAIMGYVY